MNIVVLIGIKRWKNELKRKDFKHGWRPRKKTKRKNNYEVIHIHDELCIYKAINKETHDISTVKNTISVINQIRTSHDKNLLISFVDTKRVTVAAIVLLFAAIDEAVSNGCKFLIRSSHQSSQVNALIKRAGIDNSQLKIVCSSDFTSQKPISIIQGRGAQFREEIIDHIKSFIYDENLSASDEHRYGDAVHETINNVLIHAYPEISERDEKKWWMLCDIVQDELYLAIFDQGVGIPNTVMEKGWFKPGLRSLFPKKYSEIESAIGLNGFTKLKSRIHHDISDEHLIQISMLGDVSGTLESKHGQGSKSIKALVEDHHNGKLWIFSNKGLYTLSGKDKKDNVHSLPISIGGTIVQWNIKL